MSIYIHGSQLKKKLRSILECGIITVDNAKKNVTPIRKFGFRSRIGGFLRALLFPPTAQFGINGMQNGTLEGGVRLHENVCSKNVRNGKDV
jgi:hypothetical protein